MLVMRYDDEAQNRVQNSELSTGKIDIADPPPRPRSASPNFFQKTGYNNSIKNSMGTLKASKLHTKNPQFHFRF